MTARSMTRSVRALFRAETWRTHWGPWMLIVFVALFFLVAEAFTLNARTLRDEAVREAEGQAAQTAAIDRCLASRPQLARVSRFVEGVNDGFLTLVMNSAAVLKGTPRSDPQYQIRRKNLLRLIRARENVKAIAAFPVPTVRDCKSRG